MLRAAQLVAAALALALALAFGLAGQTTAALPVAPGGPILVITDPANGFSQYYAEILRAEGLNEFAVASIGDVTAELLNSYDVAILGDLAPATDSKAGILSGWVNSGGNLIAMRPNQELASLLGLSGGTSTLANGYLQVDASRAPGAGIVGSTIQYHGDADRWTVSGANTRSVATLFSGPSTSAGNPAVTVRDVANGGQAAAFTYDLARSIVTTRQGNPAWAGLERDGQTDVIRPDDMFFPDWIDLEKVAIPQADEQQRLLANLIGDVTADRKPLPRFWYLPRDEKAAVVMTGDDHGKEGSQTVSRFNGFIAASPAGCSVAAWECVRGTSYIFPEVITSAQADQYVASGFEIALHVTTGCANFNLGSLGNDFTTQLGDFKTRYPNVPDPVTNRTHCVPWSDWASHARVEAENNIRFDTNYYYWPADWVGDRPGFFTGSGMPMRFGDSDGSMIDVYQAATQMTDESGQTIETTIDALLNGATGAAGYYGVFTANMHTDGGNTDSVASANKIVASAQAHNVPVVSSAQMLAWLDGRNNSSFGNVAWSDGALSFTVNKAAGANGLRGMLPVAAHGGFISSITRDGSAVTITPQRIKGVDYAFFNADGGSYVATYGGTRPPVTGGGGAGAGGAGAPAAGSGSPGAGAGAGAAKPKSKPTTTAGCLTLTSNVKRTVRGRKTRLTVTVRKSGRAAKGVRVDINGAGVGVLKRRTDSKGRARFTVRPRKTGTLRVRVPGQRASCKTPRVSVVAKRGNA